MRGLYYEILRGLFIMNLAISYNQKYIVELGIYFWLDRFNNFSEDMREISGTT